MNYFFFGAAFLTVFFGAAFFATTFLTTFFGAAFLTVFFGAAFFGAAFLTTFFGAAFLAAFLGAGIIKELRNKTRTNLVYIYFYISNYSTRKNTFPKNIFISQNNTTKYRTHYASIFYVYFSSFLWRYFSISFRISYIFARSVIEASFRSGMPDCRTPYTSQGQRNSISISEISNPSFVFSSARNLSELFLSVKR